MIYVHSSKVLDFVSSKFVLFSLYILFVVSLTGWKWRDYYKPLITERHDQTGDSRNNLRLHTHPFHSRPKLLQKPPIILVQAGFERHIPHALLSRGIDVTGDHHLPDPIGHDVTEEYNAAHPAKQERDAQEKVDAKDPSDVAIGQRLVAKEKDDAFGAEKKDDDRKNAFGHKSIDDAKPTDDVIINLHEGHGPPTIQGVTDVETGSKAQNTEHILDTSKEPIQFAWDSSTAPKLTAKTRLNPQGASLANGRSSSNGGSEKHVPNGEDRTSEYVSIDPLPPLSVETRKPFTPIEFVIITTDSPRPLHPSITITNQTLHALYYHYPMWQELVHVVALDGCPTDTKFWESAWCDNYKQYVKDLSRYLTTKGYFRSVRTLLPKYWNVRRGLAGSLLWTFENVFSRSLEEESDVQIGAKASLFESRNDDQKQTRLNIFPRPKRATQQDEGSETELSKHKPHSLLSEKTQLDLLLTPSTFWKKLTSGDGVATYDSLFTLLPDWESPQKTEHLFLLSTESRNRLFNQMGNRIVLLQQQDIRFRGNDFLYNAKQILESMSGDPTNFYYARFQGEWYTNEYCEPLRNIVVDSDGTILFYAETGTQESGFILTNVEEVHAKTKSNFERRQLSTRAFISSERHGQSARSSERPRSPTNGFHAERRRLTTTRDDDFPFSQTYSENEGPGLNAEGEALRALNAQGEAKASYMKKKYPLEHELKKAVAHENAVAHEKKSVSKAAQGSKSSLVEAKIPNIFEPSSWPMYVKKIRTDFSTSGTALTKQGAYREVQKGYEAVMSGTDIYPKLVADEEFFEANYVVGDLGNDGSNVGDLGDVDPSVANGSRSQSDDLVNALSNNAPSIELVQARNCPVPWIDKRREQREEMIKNNETKKLNTEPGALYMEDVHDAQIVAYLHAPYYIQRCRVVRILLQMFLEVEHSVEKEKSLIHSVRTFLLKRVMGHDRGLGNRYTYISPSQPNIDEMYASRHVKAEDIKETGPGQDKDHPKNTAQHPDNESGKTMSFKKWSEKKQVEVVRELPVNPIMVFYVKKEKRRSKAFVQAKQGMTNSHSAENDQKPQVFDPKVRDCFDSRGQRSFDKKRQSIVGFLKKCSDMTDHNQVATVGFYANRVFTEVAKHLTPTDAPEDYVYPVWVKRAKARNWQKGEVASGQEGFFYDWRILMRNFRKYYITDEDVGQKSNARNYRSSSYGLTVPGHSASVDTTVADSHTTSEDSSSRSGVHSHHGDSSGSSNADPPPSTHELSGGEDRNVEEPQHESRSSATKTNHHHRGQIEGKPRVVDARQSATTKVKKYERVVGKSTSVKTKSKVLAKSEYRSEYRPESKSQTKSGSTSDHKTDHHANSSPRNEKLSLENSVIPKAKASSHAESGGRHNRRRLGESADARLQKKDDKYWSINPKYKLNFDEPRESYPLFRTDIYVYDRGPKLEHLDGMNSYTSQEGGRQGNKRPRSHRWRRAYDYIREYKSIKTFTTKADLEEWMASNWAKKTDWRAEYYLD